MCVCDLTDLCSAENYRAKMTIQSNDSIIKELHLKTSSTRDRQHEAGVRHCDRAPNLPPSAV